MTNSDLVRLQAENAFNPSPRTDQMTDLHVPYDQLSGSRTCEAALERALRQGHRVALVGASGTGKTSVAQCVLGPLVEGLAPMRVPISMERQAIATDPVEFARHLVALIRRWIAASLPSRQGQVHQVMPRRRAQTSQKFSVAPSWMEAKVELAYELNQASIAEPTTSAQVIEQARQLIEIFAQDGLVPVVVLDDTDRWLSNAWQPDSPTVRAAFFGRVVRVLAEDLGAAAVVAVHPSYLADPSYQESAGFLDTTLHVPPIPSAAAVGAILQRRIAVAIGSDRPVVETISEEALMVMFAHYEQLPNVRKHLVLVANAALTLAVDDESERISRRHAIAAISQEDAEGP